ncbi:transporter substrate-binding domain-containing protein [Azospirillum agricola]|uniref:transporter substrate-binding domain-containing protein n=1 Tax=Azospirillum agricola TaxID=1720247 RepID=UPI000A0F14CC|nr:transporter substrate-binding domain-containing protein [Azospirillum agricola]SMH55376.1 amino acid ABC transporter substrate-binding protein, PAAT family [Azospirillum lipoferum]
MGGWMRAVAVGVALAAGALLAAEARAGTLERVREAGVLRCGVIPSGTGVATMDGAGNWTGFFPEMCRALAAAALGRAGSVAFVEVGVENRFTALRNGAIDVVMETSTWTQERELTMGLAFPAVYLFDGQGFLAHRSLAAATLAEAGTASVCVVDGTTTVRNLENWIARQGARLTIRRMRSADGAITAFFNHHCDLYTGDRVALHGQRAQNAPARDDYRILPDIIAKEPLSPVVRNDDPNWRDVVRWVVLALLTAEEKGVTAANAAARKTTGDAETRRLLGALPGLGQGLGLDDGWGLRVVMQIGNYGEIYDRTLGRLSPLAIERGMNALWTDGGLLYAPPLGG